MTTNERFAAAFDNSNPSTPSIDPAGETVGRLVAAVEQLARCLLPVHMTLVERDLIEEPVADDAVVLSFMGSGASDRVTAGEVRSALAAAEAALADALRISDGIARASGSDKAAAAPITASSEEGVRS